MKIIASARFLDAYESPKVKEYSLQSEGVLCASGVHDSLTEEDDWADLLE